MKHLLATLILALSLGFPLYGCADDVNAKGDVDVDRDEDDGNMAGNGGSDDDDDGASCVAACDADDNECIAACEG